MPDKVIVSTDSPADIPQFLAERYNISTIPLHIILGDGVFEDGVNITPEKVLEFVENTNTFPKTSAVSVDEYREYFERLSGDGSHIVHISLSSKISATHQNALIAAGETENIYVVDSLSLTIGIGLLAIKACEMRDNGMDAKTIAEKITGLREKVKTSFILENVDFLHKGGRCSGLAAFGANVLGIKPSIAMSGGALSVGKKYRGKFEKCLYDYAFDALGASADRLDPDRIFIHSTVGAPAGALESLGREIRKKYKFKEIFYNTQAGCTIISHCGRGTVGVLFMER
ncbi:MAG: DegV family protein [Oscillospiraceae bacterium]|nr:DegV family protein [Oscillospiraceae bacterium]